MGTCNNNKVDRKNRTLGNDFSAQIPVDASEPIELTEENFATGMNCPCFAKCDKMGGSEKKDCETDCANTCNNNKVDRKNRTLGNDFSAQIPVDASEPIELTEQNY